MAVRARRPLTLPDGRVAHYIDTGGVETVILGRPAPDSPTLGIDAPFTVYYPHTKIHPLTMSGAPDNARWVDVSNGPDAYYAALAGWWDDGETFMVIEHDVVCREGVIREAAECPEPWCIWGYDPYCHIECREAWRNALGCTRFRSELMREVPDALTSVPPDRWDWHNICDGLGNNLRAAGFTHHWHEPPVHHHDRTLTEAT